MLRQTFSDWEMIVSDDASKDNTEEVVRSFPDRRIHYYRNEANLGLYPNWNRCIGLASGDYVAIYHDHDFYLSTIVERCVALLDRYPKVSVVHTALLQVDAEKRPLDVDIRPLPEVMAGTVMARLLANSRASPIMAATAMVRREAYHQAGLYNPERYGLGCDLDMWFRLSQIGDIAYINEPQVVIRARSKGDDTTVFHWSTIIGALAMQRDHARQVYKDDRLQFNLCRLRFIYQKNQILLTSMIRATLMEPLPVINEGETLMRQEAIPGSLWLTRLIRENPILQQLLRRIILPIHYKRISQHLKMRSLRAKNYLETHQSLQKFLASVGNQPNR